MELCLSLGEPDVANRNVDPAGAFQKRDFFACRHNHTGLSDGRWDELLSAKKNFALLMVWLDRTMCCAW